MEIVLLVGVFLVLAVGLGIALVVLPDTAPTCDDYLTTVATTRHEPYAHGVFVWYTGARAIDVIGDMVTESRSLVSQGYRYDQSVCELGAPGGAQVVGVTFQSNGDLGSFQVGLPFFLVDGAEGDRHYCAGYSRTSSGYSGWVERHEDTNRTITDYTLADTRQSLACKQVVQQQQSGITALATVLIVACAAAVVAVLKFA